MRARALRLGRRASRMDSDDPVVTRRRRPTVCWRRQTRIPSSWVTPSSFILPAGVGVVTSAIAGGSRGPCSAGQHGLGVGPGPSRSWTQPLPAALHMGTGPGSETHNPWPPRSRPSDTPNNPPGTHSARSLRGCGRPAEWNWARPVGAVPGPPNGTNAPRPQLQSVEVPAPAEVSPRGAAGGVHELHGMASRPGAAARV